MENTFLDLHTETANKLVELNSNISINIDAV